MTLFSQARARGRAAAAPIILALALAAGLASAAAAEEGREIPPPAVDAAPRAGRTEVAILAGGCFWGVQGVFQHVQGVLSAVSGYAGGAKGTADYDQVSRGRTGHAEAVRVTFDPGRISYGRILQVYFSVAHDPTQLDRQGPDVGPQYRSAIFPTSSDQQRVAAAYIGQLSGAFGRPLATRIEPGRAFHPAEGYHQNYLIRNPTSPYIVANDLPKIDGLRRLFPALYRRDPVLVASAGR